VICDIKGRHHSVMVVAVAEPPFIQEGPIIGLRAAEGQTINLTCKVSGSPKPHVVWLKGDEQLTGGRFRLMEDGNLEIAVSYLLLKAKLLCQLMLSFFVPSML